MTIEIHSLCHNEEPMIAYFMRHYSQYGKVFLYGGYSTDNTDVIAKSLGATIIPFDTNRELRDDLFTDLKNTCWKNSDADWVIIVDTDEFVYHPNMLCYLAWISENIIVPKSFEMFSDTFPSTKGQIYEEVQFGAPYSEGQHKKLCMFKPREIKEINYLPGAHIASPIGNPDVKIHYTSEIQYFHMRHLSIPYVLDKNARYSKSRSAINKQHGWGFHVDASPADVENWFHIHKPTLKQIVL